MSSRWSLGLGFSRQYEPAAAVDHEIRAENHLLSKFQLLGPEIRLRVKNRLETGAGMFEKGVEIEVMVEAKPVQEILPVSIILVGPIYDVVIILRSRVG